MVGASDQAGEGTEQGALSTGTGTGGKVWLDTPIMMIHNGTAHEVFSQGLFNPQNHIVDQNWSYRIDQYKKRRAE